MTQALYNKWRPQKWDEVVGQQHVVQTLRNAVASNRIGHAYLFAGPRGTGKTTAARLLAKAVNCLNPDMAVRPCNECAHCIAVNENRFLDLIEIDAASQNGVEDVRDLREKINFSPNQGRYKIYIIDEVHMFSTNAFNALLKTLEEPPVHAIFILATTEMHKIPATVLSRCQRHEFRRVSLDDIIVQLQNIAKNENITAETQALSLIARQSAGGLRDAISLLDQMASTGEEITLGLTQTVLGTATSQTVISLVDAVQDRKSASGMDAIHTALDSGTDPRLLARQVVDYLRSLLLLQMGNASQVDLVADTLTHANRHAKAFSTLEVLGMIKTFNIAATDLRGGWQPSLPLELALAEIMERSEIAPSELQRLTKTAGEPKADKPVNKTSKETEQSLDEKGTITLEQVTKAWKQIRALIKPQNPSLDGLLNSCRLQEIKNGNLVIGFESEILRSKVDMPEPLEITRKAIMKVCGSELLVKCIVTNAKQATPPDVKADGMVAAAIKAGGEIVDIQE
jgi:DNA polymerase-3 subunit gamma/tau